MPNLNISCRNYVHLFLNVSVKELPNFMGKYYLIGKLLIFKYRWQNISVSNTATCLATSLLFNRTTLLPTGHVRTVQLLTCGTPDFIAPAMWPANSLDLNPVLVYQTWGSIAAVCMTLTSWSRAWLKSGNISTMCSLMKRLSSGIHVFDLAFRHAEDILNIDFNYVW